MIRKKRKTSKQAPTTSGTSNNSSSCLIFLVTLILLLFYLGANYFMRDAVVHHGSPQDTKRFEEILDKARLLAQKYKNLTGFSPPFEMPIHLRGQDKATTLLPIDSENSQVLNGASSSKINLKSNSRKKDIVIGMAKDVDPKNFVVFCASLRHVSNADVVIFINSPVSNRHKEIAQKNSIQLLDFDIASLSSDMSMYHPSSLRWPMIYKYFQSPSVRDRYGRVWMADVRDTYFQNDPFAMLTDGQAGFYVFKGVESVTIQACGWNSGWIKDCFGESALHLIGSKNIICSGVSMGDMDSVYEYLEVMADVISGTKVTSTGQISKFPQCERNGVDQGVHNVLVHSGDLSNLKIFSQSDGHVANLQAKRATIEDNVVYNGEGKEVSVVHQYDREPALQRYLFGKFVDWVNTLDPMAEWNDEPDCKQFSYRQDQDLFKAMCDLKIQGGATGPSSCCRFCVQTGGCEAFTFFSGTCYLKSCSSPKQNIMMPGAFTGYKN